MGIDATNVSSVVAYEADRKYGTEYHKRFLNWLRDFQDNDCSDYAGVTQYAGVHGGGSPRMEQIAILGSYNVEQVKNIAKRLAGISVAEKYTFDRLGIIPKL